MIQRIKYTFRYKHRKGHSIHSPFVYGLVRALFMPHLNRYIKPDGSLLRRLFSERMHYKTAYRLAQYFVYMGYRTYCFDKKDYEGEDMSLLINSPDAAKAERFFEEMERVSAEENRRLTLVIRDVTRSRRLRNWWDSKHALKLDLYRVGIIIFDKELNDQTFKLKL